MGIGSCMMLPFMLAEYAGGARVEGGAPAFFAMAYIAVFPSLIACLFFNRSVELIGPTLAGQSMHLLPLFGSILAVLFLGETFHTCHAIGIALIATGILFASVKSAPAPQPVQRRRSRARLRRIHLNACAICATWRLESEPPHATVRPWNRPRVLPDTGSGTFAGTQAPAGGKGRGGTHAPAGGQG